MISVEMMGNSILLLIIGLILGGIVGAIIFYFINYSRGKLAEHKAEALLNQAKKDIEIAKRDAAIAQKEESRRAKIELDKEIKEKKAEIKEAEDKLIQREANFNKRDEIYQKRESALDEREEKLSMRQAQIQEEKSKVDDIKREQLELLEKISGFSKEKAREQVMKQVRENMNKEIAEYIHERETEAKLQADKEARELIVSSMQRYASEVANDQTVTVVNLPNDEMKGRLIGREGRNIRSIEAVTGVDLIIDDTPEAVVLSSFDPLRREMARVTLEDLIKDVEGRDHVIKSYLIKDGRIHPTRIEEIYDKVVKKFKEKIMEYGQEAIFKLGITKMDPELIETIGKLHFRTSYGQNVLNHSIEVAELSGLLAGEIGEDVVLAKRAGLLHDIGKAIDHDMEGSHVEIGIDIANKYKEHPVVVNAIASHHGDTAPTSVIASLVAIADALSASRPGARNDSLENYIQRLTQLEAVGNEVDGVDKAFAVQAGRELRVIVKPDKVDDAMTYTIAREVKEKIEATMKYPGTIKITVVRETRAQEEAK